MSGRVYIFLLNVIASHSILYARHHNLRLQIFKSSKRDRTSQEQVKFEKPSRNAESCSKIVQSIEREQRP